MLTRRDYLKYTALAGGVLALRPDLLNAFDSGELISRAIPKSGEKLPIVGLGSSATFKSLAGSDGASKLRDVMTAFLDNGGTVFDTAPSYGASEEVAGGMVQEMDATDKIFWATKLSVAGRGGGSADPKKARAQIEDSFRYIGKDPIDLIQVHNLADIPTQMGLLRELKEEGRIRYIGVTSTRSSRYPDLAKVMREEPIDFIGVDYAIDNRESAEMILPLAEEKGIATLIYVPFGRRRLWARVEGQTVPEWAQEFGAYSWAQFFIKYIAANAAVTCVTPATSNPKNMLDNLGAAYADLPDEATRRRMEQVVDALPAA